MEELREKCILHTLALCSEYGMRFTMSELAAGLGVSKKTLYVLFPDKEALLTDAVDYVFDAVKRSEAEILRDETLSLTQKIERLIIVIPEPFREIDWNRLNGVETKYPKVYTHICERIESGWDAALSLLREGVETGVLRPFSIPVFKAMVEGSIEHFITSPELAQQGVAYTQALEEMIALLMRGALMRKENVHETRVE